MLKCLYCKSTNLVCVTKTIYYKDNYAEVWLRCNDCGRSTYKTVNIDYKIRKEETKK